MHRNLVKSYLAILRKKMKERIGLIHQLRIDIFKRIPWELFLDILFVYLDEMPVVDIPHVIHINVLSRRGR